MIIKNLGSQIPMYRSHMKFAGVVRRVESLRGRMAEAEMQVEGLFESVLSEVFNDRILQIFLMSKEAQNGNRRN